jgi:hypothetical protein
LQIIMSGTQIGSEGNRDSFKVLSVKSLELQCLTNRIGLY